MIICISFPASTLKSSYSLSNSSGLTHSFTLFASYVLLGPAPITPCLQICLKFVFLAIVVMLTTVIVIMLTTVIVVMLTTAIVVMLTRIGWSEYYISELLAATCSLFLLPLLEWDFIWEFLLPNSLVFRDYSPQDDMLMHSLTFSEWLIC